LERELKKKTPNLNAKKSNALRLPVEGAAPEWRFEAGRVIRVMLLEKGWTFNILIFSSRDNDNEKGQFHNVKKIRKTEDPKKHHGKVALLS